jgi:hypothetical protein
MLDSLILTGLGCSLYRLLDVEFGLRLRGFFD